ncbi:hypothetical protein ACFQ5Q_16340 [Luteolibacter ambystomatis]|nr:hypothetical protein [Luteolibacter ambystomatis]
MTLEPLLELILEIAGAVGDIFSSFPDPSDPYTRGSSHQDDN